jgi:predicted ATPase
MFLAPPWPEIYATDADRKHGFDAAVVEYHHLTAAFAALGYEIVTLPKISTLARADFVLTSLGEDIAQV